MLRVTSKQGSDNILNFLCLKLLFQLPEVKAFLYDDFEKKYVQTSFKKIPGRDPEALFYSKSGRLIERIALESFTRY